MARGGCIARVQQLQNIGCPDPQVGAIKGQCCSETGNTGINTGTISSNGSALRLQNRDVRTECRGIAQIEDGAAGVIGEIALNPVAIHDVNNSAAIGRRSCNHQILSPIIVHIHHQHRLPQLLAPAGGWIRLDQQAAAGAGVKGIAEQRQVGSIGREVAVGQGIEPGGRRLGRIAARHSALGLAGVLNPNAAGRITAGIEGARLGDRQPAVGVAAAVGE